VVLVVGEAHVVAPQNIAAAVGYHCLSCVTQALAAQLVVTVPRPLSPDAMRRLTTVWAQVLVLEQRLRGMTFVQIQQAIASVEREILTIVRPELTTTGPAPGVISGTASATGGPSPAATASAGSDATPTPDGAASTGTTADASSSPSPASSSGSSSAPESPTSTPSPSSSSS
jgi:putative peptide zinc metalloprotease protein